MKKLLAACAFAFAAFVLSAPATARASDELPVKIAILDSGLQKISIPKKVAVQRFDARMVQPEVVSETQQRWRGEHGTLVASVLMRKAQTPIEILAYRTEHECEQINCTISTAAIKRALAHAAKNGAQIIQISSVGTLPQDLEDTLIDLADRGVHIVLAAGNEHVETQYISLAQRDQEFIHVVGGLYFNKKAKGSAHGTVEGKDLLRWANGERLYANLSRGGKIRVHGTSYAASVYSSQLAAELSAQ